VVEHLSSKCKTQYHQKKEKKNLSLVSGVIIWILVKTDEPASYLIVIITEWHPHHQSNTRQKPATYKAE
jgi:hypothetical protein